MHTEPLLLWGQLGVSELSVAYDEDLERYLMVTLPAFFNKVRHEEMAGKSRAALSCPSRTTLTQHDHDISARNNERRCNCGRPRP